MSKSWKVVFIAVAIAILTASTAGCGNNKPMPNPTVTVTVPAGSESSVDSTSSTSSEPGAPNAGLSYDPYTPSADDPFPGLIIGTIPSGDSGASVSLVLNLDKWQEYVYQNLKNYIDDPSSYSGIANVGDADVRYGGKLVIDTVFNMSPPIIENGTAILYKGESYRGGFAGWYDKYGLVMSLGPSGAVHFKVDRANPVVSASGEEILYYAVMLGRPLTQLEYVNRGHRLSSDEAYQKWPGEYRQYMG